MKHSPSFAADVSGAFPRQPASFSDPALRRAARRAAVADAFAPATASRRERRAASSSWPAESGSVPGRASVLTQNRFATPDAEQRVLDRFASKYRAVRILSVHRDEKVRKLAKRIAHCGVVTFGPAVSLMPGRSGSMPGFCGLKTCGSVWACPVCSAKISARRKAELNDLLAFARASGLRLYLLTQTFAHGRDDPLADILARFKDAQGRFRRRRDWRSFQGLIVGTVSALEATHGDGAGWHPHGHWIVATRDDAGPGRRLDADRMPAEYFADPGGYLRRHAAAVKRSEKGRFPAPAPLPWVACSVSDAALHGLRSGWMASLAGAGLSGQRAAFDVRDASCAGDYVAKWGAAEEVALGSAKRDGAGRSPFQLLADAREGCARSGALFAEFVAAFSGKRQLVWSDGLRELSGVAEISDEAASVDEVQAEALPLRTWDAVAWSDARHRRVALTFAAARGECLDAAEFGPSDAMRWRRYRAADAVFDGSDGGDWRDLTRDFMGPM